MTGIHRPPQKVSLVGQEADSIQQTWENESACTNILLTLLA